MLLRPVPLFPHRPGKTKSSRPHWPREGMVALQAVQQWGRSRLASVCNMLGRWEFLIPLKLQGGTGCPVNPLALF